MRRGGRIAEYLYDSSAILGSLGDERFRPYFRAGRGRTIWLHLMEVYYALLRDGLPEEDANRISSVYRSLLVEFSFGDVQEAMVLRLRWHRRGKRISYSDAVGYCVARKHGMTFLTGDSEFRGAPGVMFLRVLQATAKGPPRRRQKETGRR